MPVLTTTKTYVDGNILIESDLDNLKNSWETFFNVSRLDSSNFQAGGLTGSNFATGTIASANLASSSVTTAKLANGAATPAKRSLLNYSILPVTFTGSVGALTSDLRIGLLSLTCSGVRPVLLAVIPYNNDTLNPSGIVSGVTMSAASGIPGFYFHWNGSGVPSSGGADKQFLLALGNPATVPSTIFTTIAFPSAGVQGFSFNVNLHGSGGSAFCALNGQLLALEL